MLKDLDPGYGYSVDSVKEGDWEPLIADFADLSFYQTSSYGRLLWGTNRLSHLVLTKGGSLKAAAQLRVERFPLGVGGVSYLTWGPLWKIGDAGEHRENLRNMLRALYREYVVRRGHLLWIKPKIIASAGETDSLRELFTSEGFRFSPDPQRTFVVDLRGPLSEIRANLGHSWKRNLKKGERQEVEYLLGEDDSLARTAVGIVREMKERKKYVEFSDIERIVAVNQDLPPRLKLRLAVCMARSEPVATLGWFAHGESGLPLIGGTATKGLELNASFPLWWMMIEDMKARGVSWCNLAGASRENNPGGYFFKAGLAGDGAEPRQYLGQFQACRNPLSQTAFWLANTARDRYRAALIDRKKPPAKNAPLPTG